MSPDSKERPEKDAKTNLTIKEIAVSLFYGLSIGFGTAFFGSGGGMMMLSLVCFASLCFTTYLTFLQN